MAGDRCGGRAIGRQQAQSSDFADGRGAHNYELGPAAGAPPPWRLCLAATIYVAEGDPGELVAVAADGRLDEHLLALYIPATAALYGNRYSGTQTVRWLRALAHHLADQVSDSSSGSDPSQAAVAQLPATDIVLIRLWPMAGSRRVRWHDRTLTGGFFLLLLAAALAARTRADVIGNLVFAAGSAVLSAGTKDVREPKVMNWRRLSFSTTARVVAIFLFVNGVLSVVDGSLGASTRGFARGALGGPRGIMSAHILLLIAYTVALTLVVALFFLASGPAPSSMRSGAALRRDVLRESVIAVVIGVGTGVGVAAVDGAVGGWLVGVAFALWIVLEVGLTETGPARRYFVFVLCARARGLTPFRLAAFLDWATQAGLLRMSGSAYQFRHRELQDWLAAESGD
jgi:hypothetical protein